MSKKTPETEVVKNEAVEAAVEKKNLWKNLWDKLWAMTDSNLLLTITIVVFLLMYIGAIIFQGKGFLKPQTFFNILNTISINPFSYYTHDFVCKRVLYQAIFDIDYFKIINTFII